MAHFQEMADEIGVEIKQSRYTCVQHKIVT